jgi:hypothetical protein
VPDKLILHVRVCVEVKLFLPHIHCEKATGTVPKIGSQKLDGENNAIVANIGVLGARKQ